MLNASCGLHCAIGALHVSSFAVRLRSDDFVADFICFERRLVIEVDGGQHADSLSDQRRDRWFAANGYRVLRFWNNEVLKNLDGVTTLLADTLGVKDWP